MSRSRKKLPIGGNASGSDKQDKRDANRALRAAARNLGVPDDAIPVPLLREVSNEYSFKKDGKHWRTRDPEKAKRK